MSYDMSTVLACVKAQLHCMFSDAKCGYQLYMIFSVGFWSYMSGGLFIHL